MFSCAALLLAALAVCCGLLRVLPLVEAGYTFKIQLVHYLNPNHLLIDNVNCCEYSLNPGLCVCDNAFKFCVRERGSSGCDMANIETRQIERNNDNLTFSVGDDIGSTLRNPLTVAGDVWPQEVEILWTVYDLDGSSRILSSSDVVAKLTIPVPPLVPGNITDVLEFVATNCSGCLIKLRFQLLCTSPSVGPNCSCADTNDTTGHFSCNPETGERKCLAGYMNPGSRCTECIPAAGCSEVSGYCIEPWECLCREGYTGENCTLCIGPSFSCWVAPPSSSLSTSPVVEMTPTPSPPPPLTITTTTEPPTIPTIAQPSPNKFILLTLSVVGNVVILLVILFAVAIVVLVVCGRRWSQRRRSSFGVSYRPDLKTASVKHGDQVLADSHVYESLDIYASRDGRDYVVSPLAPTYAAVSLAAVNTMYSVTEEPSTDTNVAYDPPLTVSENIAYDSVDRQEQQSSCLRMPLPNPP